MIKYSDYISSMLIKKLAWDLSYRDISERTSTTRQNIHQTLTMKAMGSLETYKELELIFNPRYTFEEYRRQFKGLLIGVTNKEIAKAVGMKSVLGLENILECRHVGQYDNYMALERYVEELMVNGQ